MKALSKTVSALPVSAALSVDLAAKALIAAGRDVVSFCVGEPDFETPEPIGRAGIRAIQAGETRYTPAAGTAALRYAVAAALKRDCGLVYEASDIVVTTGAKYAVYAAALAMADPGDKVILPAPYWTSYYHILRLAGVKPVVVPCESGNGWKLTPAQLDRAVTARTKALILNNPVNPTGAVYDRRALAELAAVCRRHDLYVIADEIYSRILYTDEPFCSMAAVDADMRERTAVVGGVSKSYAMTGWRIGYAACSPPLARAISALLSHTTGCPNTMAQAAAAEALLGPQDDVERMRRLFLKRRDCLLEALGGVPGVRFSVPQGAFYVLLDIREALAGLGLMDEAEFARRLLEAEGVATVPCPDFGAPGCLRLSYTLGEERIREGVRRLRRFIEGGAAL